MDLVTTDEALTEILSAFSKNSALRKAAVGPVRGIQKNPSFKVITQTRKGFLEGLIYPRIATTSIAA